MRKHTKHKPQEKMGGAANLIELESDVDESSSSSLPICERLWATADADRDDDDADLERAVVGLLGWGGPPDTAISSWHTVHTRSCLPLYSTAWSTGPAREENVKRERGGGRGGRGRE